MLHPEPPLRDRRPWSSTVGAPSMAFSARTENRQFHPQWGILLSRLWVK
jgi:hypothetical protein